MSPKNPSAVMSTPPPAQPERAPKSDHLSVRPSDHGPAEVHFQFEQQGQRLGGAFGVSVLSHAVFVIAILLFLRYAPDRVTSAILPEVLPDDIVWLSDPGPGGGGGGGNKMPDPPKKAELPGKEKITVPAIQEPDPVPKLEEPPIEQMNIPVQTMAADLTTTTPGVLSSDASSASTGSGEGRGAGSGQGSGLGPGFGGGMGGGAYRPGNGVEIPRLRKQVKPSYTSEAMRAKVQGVVLLECVVQTTGGVDNCSVQRSLDRTFGLDQEAIRAARQWQFDPGTRFGEPVPVLVTIELTFTLR